MKKNKNIMEAQADYYDNHSVMDVGDVNLATVVLGKTKKINIGIPQQVYTQAMGLSALSGTGYQNILKMAMVIGLNQLSSQLQQPKENQR